MVFSECTTTPRSCPTVHRWGDTPWGEPSEIVGPAACGCHITAVYLLGSRAGGDDRPDSDYDPIIGMGPDSRVSDMYAFECELKAIPGNDVDVMTAGVLLKENDFTGDVPRERIGIHRWTDTFHRPIESGRPGAFAVPPSMRPL